MQFLVSTKVNPKAMSKRGPKDYIPFGHVINIVDRVISYRKFSSTPFPGEMTLLGRPFGEKSSTVILNIFPFYRNLASLISSIIFL